MELEKVTDALAASALAPRDGQPSSATGPAGGSQTLDPDPVGDDAGIVFAEQVKRSNRYPSCLRIEHCNTCT